MNIYLNKTPKFRLRQLHKLFFNHMDAWGVTAVIVATTLSIHHAIHAQGLFLLAIITITYWFGFALNDYFDADHDCHDAKKGQRNFFVTVAPPKQLVAIFALLISVGLLLGFSQFGWRGLLVFLIAFPVAWAYSAPPLRIKSFAGLDLLTHAIFVETFPYLLVLILLQVHWSPIDFVILSALFCASLASQLEQQARDFEVDSQTDKNFTTRFGLGVNQFLMRLSSGLLIVVICFGLFTGIIPLIYLPFGMMTLPLIVHRFVRSTRRRSEKWVKILTLLALGYALLLIGEALV